MSTGPAEDEQLLAEAAEKAHQLSEQLMADSAALEAEHPQAAAGVARAAEDARRLAQAIRDPASMDKAGKA